MNMYNSTKNFNKIISNKLNIGINMKNEAKGEELLALHMGKKKLTLLKKNLK